VTSLQSFLQQQYSAAANVSNPRDGNWSCSDNGPVPSGSGISRGQSDCVMAGRLVTIGSNGQQLDSYTLVKNSAGKFFMIGVNATESHKMDWDTKISSPNEFVIWVLRDGTGHIMTYIDQKTGSVAAILSGKKFSDLLNSSHNSLNDLKMCVDPSGLFSGSKIAVYISAAATSGSDVKVLGDAESGCL